MMILALGTKSGPRFLTYEQEQTNKQTNNKQTLVLSGFQFSLTNLFPKMESV